MAKYNLGKVKIEPMLVAGCVFWGLRYITINNQIMKKKIVRASEELGSFCGGDMFFREQKSRFPSIFFFFSPGSRGKVLRLRLKSHNCLCYVYCS